jgi:hypothetical protein
MTESEDREDAFQTISDIQDSDKVGTLFGDINEAGCLINCRIKRSGKA